MNKNWENFALHIKLLAAIDQAHADGVITKKQAIVLELQIDNYGWKETAEIAQYNSDKAAMKAYRVAAPKLAPYMD